jgi:DAK2 domain fusion protein YloV
LLKEAGVVDSGAQGLYVVLDGMLRTLRGEALTVSLEGGHIDETWLRARERLHGDEGEGFCTEFVVRGEGIDREALRAALTEMGESVLVVGDAHLLRAHLHTHDPQAAFAHARGIGEVSHEKADDMQAQMGALAARGNHVAPAAPEAGVRLAVVAVGAGDGIEALLRSIGAAAVVSGGQTMNPSAGDIAAAIEATGAREVIVLPDNRNIILAAEQAAEALRGRDGARRIAVVPTRSVPQGVAALVALNIEAPFDDNVAAMQRAAEAIASAEVTRAVRTATVDGHGVREGQAIAMIDGRLDVVEESIEAAVRAAAARMVAGRTSPLITLYRGEGADVAGAEALADELRSAHGCEVEVVDGGQPHYPYFIGVDS